MCQIYFMGKGLMTHKEGMSLTRLGEEPTTTEYWMLTQQGLAAMASCIDWTGDV